MQPAQTNPIFAIADEYDGCGANTGTTGRCDMPKHGGIAAVASAALAVLGVTACSKVPSGPPPPALTPATMSRVGTVDERFQSYNIEMLEVTGGSFWKPYGNPSNAGAKSVQPSSNVPAGMNADMFQYRPPIDLTNLRTRKLATGVFCKSVHF